MQRFLTQASAYLSRWLPPLLMMMIIFWWSAQSNIPGPGTSIVVWWDFILKKVAHLTEYALLFFSLQRALNWYTKEDLATYSWAFVLLILYALSDEMHQSFTLGRHPMLRDVGFDTLGGFLVYLRLMKFV